MLLSFRSLILSSAALCTTASFAAEPKRVEVPFSFVAKHHAYQAGSYTIAVDAQKSVVTLSENGRSSLPMMWIIVPGSGDPSHPRASLTFDVSGQEHVLRRIQFEDFTTPNLNPKPKHRVESSTTIGE